MQAIYTGIAWTPALAFLFAAILVLLGWIMQLEAYFGATSYVL